jgi:serine/threonine protein kinase
LSGKQSRTNVPAANNPMWQAPEVMDDPTKNGSKAGDVYSFGIVMYELLMMSRPWPNTPLALISHHVQARATLQLAFPLLVHCGVTLVPLAASHRALRAACCRLRSRQVRACELDTCMWPM